MTSAVANWVMRSGVVFVRSGFHKLGVEVLVGFLSVSVVRLYLGPVALLCGDHVPNWQRREGSTVTG